MSERFSRAWWAKFSTERLEGPSDSWWCEEEIGMGGRSEWMISLVHGVAGSRELDEPVDSLNPSSDVH